QFERRFHAARALVLYVEPANSQIIEALINGLAYERSRVLAENALLQLAQKASHDMLDQLLAKTDNIPKISSQLISLIARISSDFSVDKEGRFLQDLRTTITGKKILAIRFFKQLGIISEKNRAEIKALLGQAIIQQNNLELKLEAIDAAISIANLYEEAEQSGLVAILNGLFLQISSKELLAFTRICLKKLAAAGFAEVIYRAIAWAQSSTQAEKEIGFALLLEIVESVAQEEHFITVENILSGASRSLRLSKLRLLEKLGTIRPVQVKPILRDFLSQKDLERSVYLDAINLLISITDKADFVFDSTLQAMLFSNSDILKLIAAIKLEQAKAEEYRSMTVPILLKALKYNSKLNDTIIELLPECLREHQQCVRAVAASSAPVPVQHNALKNIGEISKAFPRVFVTGYNEFLQACISTIAAIEKKKKVKDILPAHVANAMDASLHNKIAVSFQDLYDILNMVVTSQRIGDRAVLQKLTEQTEQFLDGLYDRDNKLYVLTFKILLELYKKRGCFNSIYINDNFSNIQHFFIDLERYADLMPLINDIVDLLPSIPHQLLIPRIWKNFLPKMFQLVSEDKRKAHAVFFRDEAMRPGKEFLYKSLATAILDIISNGDLDAIKEQLLHYLAVFHDIEDDIIVSGPKTYELTKILATRKILKSIRKRLDRSRYVPPELIQNAFVLLEEIRNPEPIVEIEQIAS
ncbi:MAG: hypothetical protein KAT71_07795, partial [Gammaproteobacteria bacterium]|nr:hypothetical protein [Gammaproteobacteria bacterium]